MSSLIKNELTKIFKKKSIYITIFVVLAFVILTNCIYKFFFTTGNSYGYSDSYISYIKEDLARLDPSKPSDTTMYIELKSQLETYELMQKYDEDAWQRQIIASQVAGDINEKNTYLYSSEKDEAKAQEIENNINDILQKLDSDDWKYFANLELEQADAKLKELEEQKANTQDKQLLEELEVSIENAKIDKEVAEYRINQDIKYGTDYLNEALTSYQSYSLNLIQKEKIVSDIQKSKEQGAEFTFVLMHWGDVDSSVQNNEQKELADFLFENGADFILGTHPASIQPMEVRENSEGQNIFIAYSTGNFISSREYTNSNIEMILDIEITKDSETGETKLTKVTYTPVYLLDRGKSAEQRYKLLDIKKEIENYENGYTENITEEEYEELLQALIDIDKLIGKE